MKVLSPTVTIIQSIHNKPYVNEAIQSVVNQTRNDWELIVLDSGMWQGKTDEVSLIMAGDYERWHKHPQIEWFITGERANLKDCKCPISWVTNEAIRAGLVRGKYFCTFYDDDKYYPEFIEKMAGYLDKHPDCDAVRCSQKRTYINPDGTMGETPPLMANDFIEGENFDCVVDGGQVLMRSSILKKIGDPWLPEDPEWDICSHSDGIFFNKMSKVIDKCHFIEDILMENCKTPHSTYSPTGDKQ